MRYPIKNVLRGYLVHRANNIDALEQKVVNVQAESEEWARAGERRRPQIAEKLRSLAHEIEASGAAVTLKWSVDIQDQLKPYFGGLPAEYDFARNRRELTNASRNLEIARQAEDPGLIQWLEVMQASGEEYVSAHAVRQAGYRPQDLATYVMASSKES